MATSACVVLVPVSHHIEPHCDLSLRQLESKGYQVHRLYGFSQVDVARNRLASHALREGFEELMWIDSDIAFEPQAVDRLRSHGLPVVCGLYPKKVEPRWSSEFLPGTGEITFGQGGGLVEIRYAAAGFLYTRRQVYLDIQSKENLPLCNPRSSCPILPFFLPMTILDDSGHHYLGEDFAFCERLRRSGHPIHADTTIRLQHIGTYGYSWEDTAGQLPRQASCTLDVGSRPKRPGLPG